MLTADRSETQREDLRKLFDGLKPWHHLIDVHGVPTKTESAWGEPLDHPIPLWEKVSRLLPPLHGEKVLDIGCNDGFFVFECKKSGAEHVVGIEADLHFYRHAALINDLLGWGGIEIKNMSAYDIQPSLGSFDITLLLGVLYHLKNPMDVLGKLSAITTDIMIVESAVRNSKEDINNRKEGKLSLPVMEFVGNAPLASGYEGAWNWWAPNTECICAMLKLSGFHTVDVAEEYLLEPPQPKNVFGRALISAKKG